MDQTETETKTFVAFPKKKVQRKKREKNNQKVFLSEQHAIAGLLIV